jgi:hypothetical protein
MWRELKIPCVYTMEASFCGTDKGALKGQHFSTDHLMMAGQRILEALLVYCNIDVAKKLQQHKAPQNLIKEAQLAQQVQQSTVDVAELKTDSKDQDPVAY